MGTKILILQAMSGLFGNWGHFGLSSHIQRSVWGFRLVLRFGFVCVCACVFPLRIITREFYCVGNETQWGVSDPVCRNTSLPYKRGLWWRPLLPNFLILAFLPEIKGHLEVLREAVIWSSPLLEFLLCLPVSFQLFISVFTAAVLVLPSDSTSFIPSLLWFHLLIWVFFLSFLCSI